MLLIYLFLPFCVVDQVFYEEFWIWGKEDLEYFEIFYGDKPSIEIFFKKLLFEDVVNQLICKVVIFF
jgi:hypothetical protein